MTEAWQGVARRAIEGLGVQPGELVQVRDHAGRPDVLLEMALAIELAGATPLPELSPPDLLRRLLAEGDAAHLAAWDRHRIGWMGQIDRVLVLEGARLDRGGLPQTAVDAWSEATDRLGELEEERRLPYLLVAVPTKTRARQLGMGAAALDETLLPALRAPADELRATIDQVLNAARGAGTLTIRSGDGHELRCQLTERRWLADDGVIDADDIARGAIVSNLPAGSIYTTVVESATEGTLWLAEASGARDVTLRFEGGRIVGIEATHGADALSAMLDRHSGESRRVGHIGIGLNPHLHAPLGWTLVDEHVQGALFLSLGENRYMGGENASSLNVDYALPNATLLVDDRVVVEAGRLVI